MQRVSVMPKRTWAVMVTAWPGDAVAVAVLAHSLACKATSAAAAFQILFSIYSAILYWRPVSRTESNSFTKPQNGVLH